MGLPEGKWDFYQCWDEGNTRSTFVDLDASQYRAELPECLTLTLHLRFPNVNNGMTTPEEAKVLNAAEDLVADDLKSEVRARFVGRVTRDGLRIFYYYVPARTGHVLSLFSARFPDYHYEVSWTTDPAWDVYHSELYPSIEDTQAMKNRNVLEVLVKHGDSLEAPRDVSHWSYFPNSKKRSAFIERIVSSGFRMVSAHEIESNNPDDFRFAAVYVRQDHVYPRAIDPLTIQLLHLSSEFDGNYDGWETQVTK